MRDNKRIIRSVVITLLLLGSVRLFGSIETLAGYGVGRLVYGQVVRSHPDSSLPMIAGVASGVVVAFLLAIAFSIITQGMA